MNFPGGNADFLCAPSREREIRSTTKNLEVGFTAREAVRAWFEGGLNGLSGASELCRGLP